MRAVGLENNSTSFALTTHMVTLSKYQKLAEDAESRVDESEENKPPQPESNAQRSSSNPQLGRRLDLRA